VISLYMSRPIYVKREITEILLRHSSHIFYSQLHGLLIIQGSQRDNKVVYKNNYTVFYDLGNELPVSHLKNLSQDFLLSSPCHSVSSLPLSFSLSLSALALASARTLSLNCRLVVFLLCLSISRGKLCSCSIANCVLIAHCFLQHRAPHCTPMLRIT
jgi:hypothetical protein